MTGAIQILTLADENYAMPLAAMGRSLFENHRSGRSLHLKIIDGGLQPATRARVERSWPDRAVLSWEWVRPVRIADLPVRGRMSALTYQRMFLDSYFDPSIERVILLDSDTLVLGDVERLYEVDLENNVIAACVDPFIPTVAAADGLPAHARTHLAADTPYFNAGVFVADLRQWRDLDIPAKALAYANREQHNLRQYDQDALNAVLAGRWKILPPKWNVQPRTPNALGRPLPSDPVIVHFSGRLKPWLYEGRTALDRLYFEYLSRTEWKSFVRPRSWLWSIYDTPFRRLLHPLERSILASLRGRA